MIFTGSCRVPLARSRLATFLNCLLYGTLQKRGRPADRQIGSVHETGVDDGGLRGGRLGTNTPRFTASRTAQPSAVRRGRFANHNPAQQRLPKRSGHCSGCDGRSDTESPGHSACLSHSGSAGSASHSGHSGSRGHSSGSDRAFASCHGGLARATARLGVETSERHLRQSAGFVGIFLHRPLDGCRSAIAGHGRVV